MKIGMVVHDMAVSGGYQKLVLRLSEQLESHGHIVTIYTAKIDRKACYPDMINKFNFVSPDNPKASSILIRLIYGNHAQFVNEYQQLAKKMDRDLDALILHDEVSLFALRYFRPRSKRPEVIWMLNNQLSPHLGGIGLSVKRHFRKNIAKALYNIVRDLLSEPINLTYRRALSKVDHFAVYDTHNQKLVHQLTGRQADLVYAGADLETFKAVRFKKHKGFDVLSVGVVFPHRRYEDLIEATKKLIDQKVPIHVTIVGRRDLDRPYSDSLLKLVHRLNLSDHVSFIDYLSDAQLLKQYASADAFAFINDAETWGIAVFEAIAAGIPTLITSNIGAADIVRNKQDGWVVAPRSPDKVADALLEIYSKPEEAKKITLRASKKIEKIVSWEAYSGRILDLMNSRNNNASS